MLFNNPETRLLIRIFAILGFIVLGLIALLFILVQVRAPHLLRFSADTREIRVKVIADSLKGYQFVEGMTGCENIAMAAEGNGFFVSSLDGRIHYVDREAGGKYSVVTSYKAGSQALGLALDTAGRVLAGVNKLTPELWTRTGALIERFETGFTEAVTLTGNYPSLNGIAADTKGNVYFTSSNFSILSPEGALYRMTPSDHSGYSEPEVIFGDAGLANGLYYDERRDAIYFSNTLEGVYLLNLTSGSVERVYLKTRFMEACDDLCTDIAGNIWMADPGTSTVKMFNPGTRTLLRFVIEGIGQTSSVRIRTEGSQEMLYITELKRTQSVRSENFDGRGVVIVPAGELIRRAEEYLTR
jgi:sugar lactone lactonase YvrE